MTFDDEVYGFFQSPSRRIIRVVYIHQAQRIFLSLCLPSYSLPEEFRRASMYRQFDSIRGLHCVDDGLEPKSGSECFASLEFVASM